MLVVGACAYIVLAIAAGALLAGAGSWIWEGEDRTALKVILWAATGIVLLHVYGVRKLARVCSG